MMNPWGMLFSLIMGMPYTTTIIIYDKYKQISLIPENFINLGFKTLAQ